MATNNVFLFIPNIIGYARVIIMLITFYVMPYHPIISGVGYVTSQLLDAVDGHAARTFNQCSSFGAVLDMVTDRVSTLGLMIVLSLFNSDYVFVYQCLIILDISSHWLQMYSSLLCGEKSHKKSTNFFLNLYYTNRIVLFLMCAGNELFFISLYLQNFVYSKLFVLFQVEWTYAELLTYLCFPVFFLKQVISVIQLITASRKLAAYDTANAVANNKE